MIAIVPSDVTGAWIGDDPPSDSDLVFTWIGKAEREAQFQVPDLAARLDDGEPDLEATYRDVIVAMVTRVFRNPEGIRQTQETDGPFSQSRTYGGDAPGELALTDRELARLQRTRTARQAHTVSLIPASSPFA